MSIDILSLEPSQISKNLKGKYILIYSAPKCGKTTLLTKFPKSLVLSFEPGTNALNNVLVQRIIKWSEFKTVVSQLETTQAQEKFDFIGIDTADKAWDLCEKYICSRYDAPSLADIPYGKGYDDCKREYSECIYRIANAGYGLCFTSHIEDKKIKVSGDVEVFYHQPALAKRPYDIINKLVDITTYVDFQYNPQTKKKEYWMHFRSEDSFFAGSRYHYMTDKIPFSYENLTKAIYDAIDQEVATTVGSAPATQEPNLYFVKSEERSYEEVAAEARQLWNDLVGDNNITMVNKIFSIVEKIFGKKMKLSDITESQVDLYELVVAEMRTLK